MITRKMGTFKPFQQFSRRMSVLYMTGDKAKDAYSPISPYIDLKSIFSDVSKMEQNLKYRNSKINFSDTMEKYKKFDKMFVEKQHLEKMREDITSKLRSLQKSKSDETQINILKERGKQLRNYLHSLKESLYPIENDFIERFLELPNELSPQCPTNEHERIIFRFGDKLERSSINHLEHPSVNYNDKFNYYLLNEAANFDIDFSYTCFDKFLNKGYSPITNADFTKRVLTEAFGSPTSKFENIIEDIPQVNFLQLTGCGSMESFLGYFAKLSVFSSVFPLKLVSIGKSYETVEPENHGVYSAQQSNRVQVLTCYENSGDSDLIMDEILNEVVDLYKNLDTYFRIVYLPAKDLQPAESLSASIQMFSPYYGKYFEVGRISDYKNYVSKRMLFNYKEGKQFHFGNMIGGTVVNTSRLAMIIIESGKSLEGCAKTESPNPDSIKTFKNLFV